MDLFTKEEVFELLFKYQQIILQSFIPGMKLLYYSIPRGLQRDIQQHAETDPPSYKQETEG